MSARTIRKALVLGLIITAQLALGQQSSDKASAYLKSLYRTMQGRYNSAAQAKADPDFYNISLKMLPIWPDRGYFLYVEQALADRPDKPYRVRIYRLVQHSRTEMLSEIYTPKDESAWVGKWTDKHSFDHLNMDDLVKKEGCDVKIRVTRPNRFEGYTQGNNCPSDLRGASYATTSVTITPKRMSSWDQGFDAYGKQVWGPTKGPYHFDKVGKP
ncbi:MAG: chromophore lyase CpcT/CpeT [Bacteroidetes bacterium]|nr:chromophore lyase CpcT/CpeT [Bacteroidota bacterium]